MTSSEGRAIIRLNDGGELELGPDTLVKLQFESLLSGLPTNQKIEIISGTVSGKSGTSAIVLKNKGKELKVSREKPQEIVVARTGLLAIETPADRPSPSPTPTVTPEVALSAPALDATLRLDKLEEDPALLVSFQWKTNIEEFPVELVVRRPGQGARPAEEVARKILSTQGTQGATQLMLRDPGRYEWELSDPRGKPLKASPPVGRFSLAREVIAIGGLAVSIDGRSLLDLEGYQPDLSLESSLLFRWNPIEKAEKYTFEISKTRDFSGKPIYSAVTDETAVRLSAGKLLGRRVFFRISAPLTSGFVALSRARELFLSFGAPTTVYPSDKERVPLGGTTDTPGQVLLTWTKVSMASRYEVQLAPTAEFEKGRLSQRTPENFLLLKNPRKGRFFWRVRSISDNKASSWSIPAEFTVVP
jgi:hypothetical protein